MHSLLCLSLASTNADMRANRMCVVLGTMYTYVGLLSVRKEPANRDSGSTGAGGGGVIVVRSHRSVIPHYIRNTCSAGKRLPLMWSRARKVAVAMRSRRKLLIMHTRNLRGFVWLLATEPGAKMRLQQQLAHVEKKTSQWPPNCFSSKLLLPAPVQLYAVTRFSGQWNRLSTQP